MTKKEVQKVDEKAKIIDAAVMEIRDKYGEGAIMKLGEARRVDVDVIPTGSISLDIALGVMGMPRGRVVEIYGPESSGKTTLALDVVVVDSVAALTPKAEIEGEMGQQHVGLQARLMSHALRKLTAVLAKSKTVLIFINQIRHNIGVMFGNPETTTGGKALKFYSSVRIDVRRIAQVQSGEKIIGGRHRAKVVKNKVAPPFRQAEFDILYNEGISRFSDLVNSGVKYGILARSGAWYNFY